MKTSANLSAIALIAVLAGCSGTPCDPGTENCTCLSDGSCRLDGLTCTEGICQARTPLCAGDVCAPANPKCFTPCAVDTVDEQGNLRRCAPDGLMQGCIGNMTCEYGSCLPTEASSGPGAPGTCSIETDCPDYQTCILGRCFSDCDGDSDCSSGRECYRRVCRETCSDEKTCPDDGYACLFSGVCLALAPPGSAPVPPAEGGFTVTTQHLAFTHSTPTQTFTISNESDYGLSLVVKKAQQRTKNSDGSLDVRLANEGETPLIWLEMGLGTPLRVQELPITVPAGGSVTLSLSGARNEALPRWTGALQIVSEELGTKQVRLEYSEEVPGRWQGAVYHFGNFEDGARPSLGQNPIDDWANHRDDLGRLAAVPNAFLQAWGRFRNDAFSLEEMKAILQTTVNGSWQSDRVQQLCSEAGYGSNAACAPFGGVGSASVIPYTSAKNVNRVPSAVVELDLVLNLGAATPAQVADPGLCGAPGRTPGDGQHCFVGRIDSSGSLQYGGNPLAYLRFEEDPLTCQSDSEAGCIARLADLGATITVGGRYVPEPGVGGCGRVEGMERIARPWLVPAFTPPGGGEDAVECRDSTVPFAALPEVNRSYAGANPVPDGRPRVRRLELIDGLMVDQSVMLLIIRETTDAFHGGQAPFASYAFVLLEKTASDLDSSQLQGNLPTDERDLSLAGLELGCDPDLVHRVIRRPYRPIGELFPRDRLNLARAMITGSTSPQLEVSSLDEETIHTLCIWDEQIQASGPDGTPLTRRREVFGAGRDGATACPPASVVVLFALNINDFIEEGGRDFNPANLDCNVDGGLEQPEACLEVLERWVSLERGVRLMPRVRHLFPEAADETFTLSYECEIPGRASCEGDRFDLRRGKVFFAANPDEVFFNRIETDIHEAFRYRTQFGSRSGAHVGFTPTVCLDGPQLVPYCYDAGLIEQVAERVDCALALYHHHLETDGLDPETATLLREYLIKNFAVLQVDNPGGDPRLDYGFERLSSELLIMLGDDALTASFASRFDLAGSRQLAFEGGRFEVDGPDLTGIAGFELYKLYQATQYYEKVLDRFYRLSPLLWADITGEHPVSYVTQATVTTYLDRVIRASAQLATAAGEIARRYLAINRPDLGRRVLERAYTRAYQESLILSRLMEQIAKSISPAEVDQVIIAVEQAQRRYRIAMLDMKRRYDGIDDAINHFGLPPDYIPFPALDEDDVNGFEVMYERATSAMEAAAEQEQRALESSRDFDVDEAEFHAELVDIRTNYETQLGELCGTFVGNDGRVYPAIARHAHLSPVLANLTDPCGAVGAGAIWLQFGEIETRVLELRQARQEADNIRERARIAQDLVMAQCGLINEDAVRFMEHQGAVNGWAHAIDSLDFVNKQADKLLDMTSEITTRVVEGVEASNDAKVAWAGATVASLATYTVAATVHFVGTLAMDAAILVSQVRIRDLEKKYEHYNIQRECVVLQTELGFTLREIHLDTSIVELDLLQAIQAVGTDTSILGQLDNERRRVQAEWEEMEQLAINVAAAKDDPNVRIYKNDAVINADRAFERALREAYRATRMFQYYTSQSYADFEKLFLVRMVDAGDISLRNYLAQLEDDFFEFEDQFGNPDTRVGAISLRDEVFRIPRYALDDSGRPLTAAERVQLFRERLQSPSLLDDNGWLTVKFNTDFRQLSPLTHNHKILFIEVEFLGDIGGDQVGRVYLRQRGTGVLSNASGDRSYYAFPPKTAVMNPILNGNRDFGQDSDGAIAGPVRTIFRNFRFRERPYVNTGWEFVLNQRTERVNEDINLDGLDDIQLNVYYTDFTNPN